MKIEILNLTIKPDNFGKGTSPCNIQYQGKWTDGDRRVKVTYSLDGDDEIWFIENEIETKIIGPKDHIFSTKGTNIDEPLKIKVTSSSPKAKIAFIKVFAKDKIGYQVTKNKGITYG